MPAISKNELAGYLLEMGAYQVGVADPRRGFEHALPGRHPLDIMPECRSVVVFAVPRPAWTNDTAIATASPVRSCRPGASRPLADSLFHAKGWTTVSVTELLRQRIWYAASDLLRSRGCLVGQGYVQEKLCSFEAGIGIYGRSGLIINPVLGNRLSPGVLLTDLELETDGPMRSFHPCTGCSLCAEACPAGAYRMGEDYPGNWSRDACVNKRRELAAEGIYCNQCFRSCQAGSARDPDLAAVRHLRSLDQLVSQGGGSVREHGLAAC